MPQPTPPETPRNVDRAAAGAAAQRTAEQAALRNVRRELDHLQAEQDRQRKLNKVGVLVVVALLLVLAFVFFAVWRAASKSAAERQWGVPVQIPSKVDLGKKPTAKPAEPAK